MGGEPHYSLEEKAAAEEAKRVHRKTTEATERSARVSSLKPCQAMPSTYFESRGSPLESL
jgi:hypothetical protein